MTSREDQLNQHGLEIIIKEKSQDFFAQDLHTKAVTTLIEEADVGGWEKHNQGDTDPLSDFCAAILVAVTKLYAHEGFLPEDEEAHIPPLGEIFFATEQAGSRGVDPDHRLSSREWLSNS